jgi:hypothetical protein
MILFDATVAKGTAVAWGALGALFTLLVVQVFPAGVSLLKGASLDVSIPRVVGALIVVVVFLAAGAVAAIQGNPSDSKGAFFYGVGCQTLLAGLWSAAANAT